MRPTVSMPPALEHFRLEQLAEGVYAAIALRDGGGDSNAGIIDLGDRTLLYDTMGMPSDAFLILPTERIRLYG